MRTFAQVYQDNLRTLPPPLAAWLAAWTTSLARFPNSPAPSIPAVYDVRLCYPVGATFEGTRYLAES